MGIKVHIFNREYNLKANENEEYLKTVAAYVDDKIRKIAASSSKEEVEQISVLACLNIADELYKLRERNRRAKEKIQQLIEKLNKEAK